ncbi:MAG: T6SS immunity protein Tdi1 domain-containing protein [Thermoanaerobaculia bacterium]
MSSAGAAPGRYFVSPGTVAADAVLADWRWALDGACTLLGVTRMGDAFVIDPAGRVIFLDTLEGLAREVAPSVSDFEEILAAGTRDDDWFLPGFVEAMERKGSRLEPGECYSYRLPPVLGGPIEVANLHVMSILVHFSLSGQLHEQLRRLPKGARISGFELAE